ncbi:hypothetical protein AB5I41_18695 [Sphingomonas sp. MMS24-JH45]
MNASMLATSRDAMYGWTATRAAIGQTAIGQAGCVSLRSRLSRRGRGGAPRLPRRYPLSSAP